LQRLMACVVLLALGATPALPQAPTQGSGESPKEIVDALWRMATTGELLTPEGWDKAARSFFILPAPSPGSKVTLIPPRGDKVIYVVSNDWGPPDQTRLKDNTAEVVMGFEDLGRIDAALKYIPPQERAASKSGMLYHLVYVQTHWVTYRSDGKTLIVDKEMTGPMGWQIEGLPVPWTTVNTAIRYVLEMREKTTDPTIRKNADQTLAKLMKLH
jgi:hypothetical protein